MRKEVLFAIIAGAIFGLIIAFGIWRANISLKSTDVESEGVGQIAPSTPIPTGSSGLVIAKPDQNAVITDRQASVIGLTNPNSWVSISGESKDYIIQSKNDGSFSQEVDLVGGVNEIKLTSFSENGVSFEESLLVVYSSEFEKTTNNE